MQHMIEQLFAFFSGAGRETALLLISMIPIIELRGAIPFGALVGMPWMQVFLISVVGNLLPVPIIILFVRPVFAWLKKTKMFAGIANKFESLLLRKADKVTRYEVIGLMLFVAIPLPGTGAWTGAGIAALLGMRMKPAFLSIFAGVVIAGVIMTLLSYGVVNIAGIL